MGRAEAAIMRYEAAMGLGMSMGPLLGGLLGARSWNYPFFGAATMMLLALFAVWRFVQLSEPVPAAQQRRGLGDVFSAHRYTPFLVVSVAGLLYYFGFFLLLGYTPLFLHLSTLALGLTFFGWGLMLGLGSTKVAEALLHKGSASRVVVGALACLALVFLLLGFAPLPVTAKIALVGVSGLFFGLMNATLTTLSVEVSDKPRAVATSAYNFLRWLGAAAAPLGSGLIAEHLGLELPYAFGAGTALLAALLVLAFSRQIDAARRTQ